MRVVVCGAGIAGLAAAGAFAARGDEVVVLERAPGPRPQGYMIDFFGPGYRAAELTGALPAVRERGYRVEEVAYLDAAGRRRAGLPFARFATARGAGLVSVMRPDLEAALAARLPDRVEVRYGAAVSSVEDGDDGAGAVLDDGSTVGADLLVGADGIHSVVRRRVAGPERGTVRHLGLHTAAFTVDDRRVHAALRGRFCVTDTTERLVGAYGLRDGRVAVFTAHRSTAPVPPADPRATVRAEYAGLGWVVPRLLELCPPASQMYYDEVAQVEAPRWRGRRVVLVGDAAHAVSLLAGQGASLAVAGALVLAERVRASGPSAGPADYEARWRPVVTAVQRSARRGMDWFLPRTRTRVRVRRAALRLAVLPAVNRLVAGVAAGTPVDLDAVLADRPATRASLRP